MLQAIVDLLQEANFWAAEAGADLIHHRARPPGHRRPGLPQLDRVARLMQDEVLRKTIHIETNGEAIGQINGLSVLQLGNYAVRATVAHHRHRAHGARRRGQHRARGQPERADPLQGRADPGKPAQRAVCH
jgi:predicted ATP-dependent protease